MAETADCESFNTIADSKQESVKECCAIRASDNLDSCDDDTLDIDLSDVVIASASSKTADLDEQETLFAEGINENYKNLMTACSTNTQNIKETITQFLSSRESVTIEEVDPTAELQESLNKKIADFEKTVSGCFTSDKNSDDDERNCVSAIEETGNIGSSLSTSQQEDTDTRVLDTSISRVPDAEVPDSSKISKMKLDSEASDKSSVDLEKQAVKSEKDVCKSNASEEDKAFKKPKISLSKKKGEKTIDQIFKSLGNGTAEEKLQVLCRKHLETLEELRTSDHKVKQFERQVVSQQREKEQLQADHNRMILAKSRLEGLCREMQRQSKAIKEESLLRIKEEEEKRKEVAKKFQTTLNDIIALNQEVSKKNIQLREENAELTTKLKSLIDNYEVWEKNMSKIIQQKELEAQLAKAKHAKVNLLLKQETEKFLREKQSLLENLSELQKRCTLLTTNELQLRTELSDYTTKYEEFQNVLSNSSKVFASFKTDMEATSKKIKKLEKETNVYKQKWESSNNALLDMISQKEKQDKDFQNAQQRILTLEKLCRALQAERNDLRNQLNIISSNSISTTPPEVPETEVA